MQSSYPVTILYPFSLSLSLSLLAARGPIAGPAPTNCVVSIHPAGLYKVKSALVVLKPMLDYTSKQINFTVHGSDLGDTAVPSPHNGKQDRS